ncbi:Rrf2 family transcriptional regulator [Candidatus Poribacteria bacterium]|nr:Rrf2 family transcriptional regulator [Candidatus Poribacteria bacterium]
MQLTRGADYALRGLLYLARQPKGKLVMASEIAAAERIPEYFFSKLFQNLAKGGVVNSFRGSNGGFVLARSAKEITVLEVIEAIDGPVALNKCADSPEVCEKSGSCPFHEYWKEAQKALVSTLGKYTLADAVAHVDAIAPKH